MNDLKLKALISLIDDPDKEIFEHVEQSLINWGPEVIPYLEDFWKSSFDPLSQSRIENIIHNIQFDQLLTDIQLWAIHKQEDLLDGLIIINRYQYPNLDETAIHLQIGELRRTVWMELMYEMSPFEKIKLLNNILFKEFGLSGNTSDYHTPQNSYISSVLESKKGNPISLSCIYSIIAQKLDIPIYGINLPKHFIAAYVENIDQSPLFYINVFNKGQIMKHEDIYSFLNQLNLPHEQKYTEPCRNLDILKRVLRNLITAYNNLGETVKKDEISLLLKVLNEFD